MGKQKRMGRGRLANELLGTQSSGSQYEAATHRPAPRARLPRRPYVDSITLKRAFMLQNFQFVLRADLLSVKMSGGQLPQGQRRLVECLRSSDQMVPWEAVHSVVVRTTVDDFQCPICLELPTAPRITECGHTYCLPCVLRYLRLQKEGGLPRTCPVCSSIIAPYALRPCRLHPVRHLAIGQHVRFDLFLRERYSCILHRYDDPRVVDGGASFQVPISELALPSCTEPCGIQSRYVLTTSQYESSQRLLDATSISERLRTLEEVSRPMSQGDAEEERFLLESLNEVTQEPKGLSPSLLRSSPPLGPRPVEQKEGETRWFEMYVEGEGQPYYLHMVSVKMLRHDAKLRGMPMVETVSAPIEAITEMNQDEETRRIYKVFSHVPLHGTIKLCVLDLQDVVLPDTMLAFQATLAEMRTQRRVKERAENQHAEEDASWRQYLHKYSGGQLGGYPEPAALSDEVSCFETESMPYLQLSTGSGWSDHGLPPNTLDTRQRATKRQDLSSNLTSPHPQPKATSGVPSSASINSGCWASGGSAAKLFAKNKNTSAISGTTVTWGRHEHTFMREAQTHVDPNNTNARKNGNNNTHGHAL